MIKMNVAELFAGVGGFRYGFEKNESTKNFFNTVFFNQWEPNKKIQHAYECYVNNFNIPHDETTILFNKDISLVNEILIKKEVKLPNIDLVVGGFPCQDYSVASVNSKGIEGKKGVLWWEIEKFISINKPSYILLENVDRLLISPRKQKGRDFLIMLFVLYRLGYDVEWRVINAAEYGFVQRRKRVFIFAHKKGTNIHKIYKKNKLNDTVLTKDFELKKISEEFKYEFKSKKNSELINISNEGKFEFKNYGYLKNGKITTFKTEAIYNGNHLFLDDILLKENDLKKFNISKNEFNDLIISDEKRKKIHELKNGRKIERIVNGFKYNYSEGKMSLFDNSSPDKKARTMLTSEGSINRSTHLIKMDLTKDDLKSKYRFLHPIEAERINGFDDNWTKSVDSIKMRYFLMGNALVVDLIKKLGSNIMFYESYHD